MAEPGEKVAKESFSNHLFTGELTEKIRAKIKSEIGVDVESSPSLENKEEYGIDSWKIPGTGEMYLIVRKGEKEGQSEILAFEKEMLFIFSE